MEGVEEHGAGADGSAHMAGELALLAAHFMTALSVPTVTLRSASLRLLQLLELKHFDWRERRLQCQGPHQTATVFALCLPLHPCFPSCITSSHIIL